MDIDKTAARYIKGVGPQRQNMLRRLSISTVTDCLWHLPRRYEDRSNIKPIAQLIPDQAQTFMGEVLSSSVFRTKRGYRIFQLAISDGTAKIYVLWFNQPYMRKYFNKEDKLILYGKIQKRNRLEVIHPEYEIIKDDEEEKSTQIHTARIVPIYPLVSGVNQRRLRSIIKNCLDQYASYIKEYMPVDIRARHHLLDLKSALLNIHFPINDRQKREARRRLVFDEFMSLQIALALRRHKIKTAAKGVIHTAVDEFKKVFIQSLPFTLTKAQTKVIEQIEKDMSSSRPMHRLLQGEVGSGKTVVSAYALALTAYNNHQGVIMVPTEILARQHYVTLSKMLLVFGVEVVLLINDVPKKEKLKNLELIQSGKAKVIVGTHTLIQEAVKFKDLGLMIIDEQHKFGVEQRATFANKGYNPHMLVMSATPIPRTLAMCIYGDMDMSVINEMPLGPRQVETFLVSLAQKQKAYDFLKEEIKKGKQGYIVSPVIEESYKLQIEGAEKLYEKLKKQFGNLKLALMHGRLKSEEKQKTMQDFKKGKIDILVCTTVIEVGIDVPKASVMIIENAERFGLSQLHQMRGRIGRGSFQSYCVLISDQETENAISRMDVMASTDDGFKIAEEDMAIRGTGEVFGKRQHGLPELALADLNQDIEVLEQAREEAFKLIKDDPSLSAPRHNQLKEKVISKFKDTFALGMIG